MTKLTTRPTSTKMMVITIMLMIVFVNVAHLNPTGDRDESSYTESAKVSQLRRKLIRLHDILKAYEKNESSLDDQSRNDDVSANLPQASDRTTGNDVSLDKMPKTAETIESVHQKPRALRAEDMDKRRTFERDTDEAELDHLGSVKTKRQGLDSVQILAKALSQMKTQRPSKQQKGPAAAIKKSKAISNSNQDGKLRSEAMSEADLMDALVKLVEDEERQSEGHDKTLPLFHNNIKGDNKQSKWPVNDHSFGGNRPSTVGGGGGAATGSGGHPSFDGNRRDDNNSDNGVDNGDDDDDDDDDLIKYLQGAGYSVDDLKATEAQSRGQVIEELENRLMGDIELANDMGISVSDLIQDLEDKAFREALIRRLRRLLDTK